MKEFSFSQINMPILKNHDEHAIIGKIYSEDGHIYFKFFEEIEITKDMLFEIFGNAALKLIVFEAEGEKIKVRKGEIIEFSLPELSPTKPNNNAEIIYNSDGALYGVVEWINDNPILDGMPYFQTKSKAMKYIGERLGALEKLKLENIEVRFTIIQLKKGV